MRVAGSDDDIPLLEPVTTSTGAKLTRIPVKKGQLIQLGIGYYNRSGCMLPFACLCINVEYFYYVAIRLYGDRPLMSGIQTVLGRT